MKAGDKHKTILVVDDDNDYCELTRLRLEGAGFEVLCACDGREALALLEKRYRPDLIIMDIDMPEKNGLTTLIELNVKGERLNPGEWQRPHVIVATGLEDGKIQAIMMNHRADDYLKKPYTAHELIKKVTRFIGDVSRDQ
ncbi:MAG: hypothetical protein A3G87_01415 [Omnitrophica bacterium RIFCSPLOWO2_12_FULL_50_11]|nr:MAG: hypothetical protein A3G87_01415 [Omnitrophica bacterium RIFCSPLOWO2_12_FULL_50_11]